MATEPKKQVVEANDQLSGDKEEMQGCGEITYFINNDPPLPFLTMDTILTRDGLYRGELTIASTSAVDHGGKHVVNIGAKLVYFPDIQVFEQIVININRKPYFVPALKMDPI